MDAVKFVIYKSRYCNSHFCDECPIYDECENEENPVAAATIVEEVEKWAKSHLLNTRASLFFKQYPDAPKNVDGYPEIGPCEMNKKYVDKRRGGCQGVECLKCREEYWGEEIE